MVESGQVSACLSNGPLWVIEVVAPTCLQSVFDQVKAFCKKCSEVGIDGLIIPDLPINYFEANYKSTFKDLEDANEGLLDILNIRLSKVA